MLPQYFKKAKLAGDYTKDAMLAQEKNRCKKETVIDRIQLLGQKIMHLNSAAALSTSIEYYRFMAMKAEYDIDDEPSKLAPSALIDDLWHTHLLDTRSYMMLESLLLPEGGRIHHNPIKDEQADYEGRLTNAKNLYYDLYHSLPPHDIWGNEVHLESPTAQAVENGGVISDPEEVDDGAIISEAEEIEHGRIITIEIHHPKGMRLSVRIEKKALGQVLFDACVKKWQVDPDSISIIFDGQKINPYTQWALTAENGDIVHFIIHMRGC
jgi:hypothetical protein